MDATLSAAAENGSRAVWLSVSEENVRAQKFYAKNGFRTVGGMNFPTGRLVLRDFVLERAVWKPWRAGVSPSHRYSGNSQVAPGQ
jgi:hypothetical protein